MNKFSNVFKTKSFVFKDKLKDYLSGSLSPTLGTGSNATTTTTTTATTPTNNAKTSTTTTSTTTLSSIGKKLPPAKLVLDFYFFKLNHVKSKVICCFVSLAIFHYKKITVF
jgi:hypothetical protein